VWYPCPNGWADVLNYFKLPQNPKLQIPQIEEEKEEFPIIPPP